MFRRKATLGTQSLLGNKDRKRLREQALKAFPRLTEEQFDLLLPSKEELSVAKLQLSVHLTTTSSGSSNSSSSSAGASSSSKKSSSSSSSLLPPVLNPTGSNRGVVYISRSEPIFFEVNGLLSPSVYALWRVPEILPSFVIHSPVSSFILRGADLMLPGILLPLTIRCEEKFGAKTNRSDTRGPALPIELQELWSIRVVGNRYPFAVGRSVVSAGSLHHLGGKGKAVEILHHFADGLWQIGPETSPNSSFTLKEILGGEEEEDDFDTPAESVRPQADLPSSPSSFQGRLAPCLQSRSSIGSHGKVDTSGAAEDADAEDDGWGIGKERKEEEERERRGEEGVDRRDNYRDDGGRSVKEERQDGGGEQEEEGERDEDSDRAEKRHSDEDRGEGEEEEDDERDLNDRKGNEEKNKEQLLRLQQQEEEEEAPQQQEAPGVPSLSTEAMDDYLYFCALEILHALSDEQLPMDISALNSKISSDASAVYFEKLKIPEKPSQFIPPDLRKSSHK
ncbi:translation initiation factor sui1 protein, partial [Cystoisospora suis]